MKVTKILKLSCSYMSYIYGLLSQKVSEADKAYCLFE